MLGIIGLVIGGIWVAAASVMKKQKINNALEMFSDIMATVRENSKTYTGATWIEDLVAKHGNMAPGFTLSPGPTSLARPGLNFGDVGYSPTGGLGMFINFVEVPSYSPTVVVDAQTCIALSATLLSLTYDVSAGSINWVDSSYGGLKGAWAPTDASKPSPTDYADWCADTARISVYGIIP